MDYTKYYIYAFDIAKRHITAALSCPDVETAKQVYLIASRKMESEYNAKGFKFGYTHIDSQNDSTFHASFDIDRTEVTIDFILPPTGNHKKGWAMIKVCGIDDFVFAESQTEKALYASPKNCQRDIQFMYFVKSALAELTGEGFATTTPPWEKGLTPQPAVEEKLKPKKPKNTPSLPKKPRKQRLKKYEVPVTEYLAALKQSILEGYTPQATVVNLSYKDIAKALAKADGFSEQQIESIEHGVRHTEAWKNRKETLKEIYDTAAFRNRRTGNTPYQDVQ